MGIYPPEADCNFRKNLSFYSKFSPKIYKKSPKCGGFDN